MRVPNFNFLLKNSYTPKNIVIDPWIHGLQYEKTLLGVIARSCAVEHLSAPTAKPREARAVEKKILLTVPSCFLICTMFFCFLFTDFYWVLGNVHYSVISVAF